MVAILWQHFLAESFAIPLRPAARLTLFLTVWAIYLADRLLDLRRHPQESVHRIPHSYYRPRRRAVQILMAAVLLADLAVAVLWLRPRVFETGIWLATGVLLYLAVFALLGRGGATKPFLAATLFATGVFLVAVLNGPDAGFSRERLLAPATSFFLLCLVNILMIGSWELSPPGVRSAIRWPVAWLAIPIAWSAGVTPWTLGIAGSAAGLDALGLVAPRVESPAARRVLADAVLLAPLAVLVWK